MQGGSVGWSSKTLVHVSENVCLVDTIRPHFLISLSIHLHDVPYVLLLVLICNLLLCVSIDAVLDLFDLTGPELDLFLDR